MIRPTTLLLVLFMTTLACMWMPANAQITNSLREDIEYDELDEMDAKLNDSALTKEMIRMEEKTWRLEAPDVNRVKNGRLRSHLRKYMPSEILLKTKPGKLPSTFRALAKTQDGQKLRAVWKRHSDVVPSLKAEDVLRLPYEEVARRKTNAVLVDFEIQLPPLRERSGKKATLPALVYTMLVERGKMNPEAVIVKDKASVKLHPQGIKKKGAVIDQAFVTSPMKAGVMDPMWARGRTFFRKGRSVGKL